MYVAPELTSGDEVRVIAPSMSMSIFGDDAKAHAVKTLENMGLIVTFGKNVYEEGDFNSSSVKSRLDDLNDAFGDKSVKLILCALGGFNSHQLLDHIDYDLIKHSPKRICGFSDATAILSAIHARTGLVTYSGPCFSNFGMLKGRDYIDEYFRKAMFEDCEISVSASPKWSDDKWFIDQEDRTFYNSDGYWIINEGSASGTITGGNIGTFRLLYGTKYIPYAKDIILFLEDDIFTGDENSDGVEFDRNLQCLIHQPFFEHVRGIVIGRFPKGSAVTKKLIMQIIATKPEFKDMPIIANVDFGHTTPFFTFPIGGTAKITGENGNVKIAIR